MGTVLQIGSIPEELERRLKERAAQEGMTMSEYVVLLISKDLALPSHRAFIEQLSRHEPVELGHPAALDVEAARRDEGS